EASSASTGPSARTPSLRSPSSGPVASMHPRLRRSSPRRPSERLRAPPARSWRSCPDAFRGLESGAVRLRKGIRAPRPRRRRIRKLRLLALLLVLFLLSSVAFTLGVVRAVASEIPALDPANQRGDLDTFIYDSNTRSPRVLARLTGSESRVLLKSISDV